MVVSGEPIMVPGVWGPYFGAMLPGIWLNEGGQSAAGALLDWTLRQSDAWPLAQETAAREQRNVYAVLNDWVADLARARAAADPRPARAARPPRQPLAAGRPACPRHRRRG